MAALLAAAPAGAQQGDGVAERYVAAWTATLRADADEARLDELIELFAPGVVYEHPRAGARIEGRDVVRSAMSRFLGSTRRPRVEISDRLAADGVVVLGLDVSFESRSGGEWVSTSRRQVLVIEISDERISRLIDYW